MCQVVELRMTFSIKALKRIINPTRAGTVKPAIQIKHSSLFSPASLTMEQLPRPLLTWMALGIQASGLVRNARALTSCRAKPGLDGLLAEV